MAFMSCFTEAAAAEADSVASFDGLDIRLCRPGTPLLKPLWFMSPVVNRRILSVGGQVRSGNGSLWLGGREKDKLQVHCTLINYYMQCLFRFTPVLFVLITCAQYKDMGQSNSDWTATTPVCVKQFRSRSQLLIVLTSLLIQHSTIVWISGLEFTKNTQDTETLRPTKDDRLTSPSQLFAIRNCWISFFQRWIILFHALLFRFTPVLNVCVYYALGAVRTILTCVNQIVTKTVVATSSYHCEGITSTYPHIHTPDCTMTGDTANTWQLLGTDHVIPTREVAAEEGNCDNEER